MLSGFAFACIHGVRQVISAFSYIKNLSSAITLANLFDTISLTHCSVPAPADRNREHKKLFCSHSLARCYRLIPIIQFSDVGTVLVRAIDLLLQVRHNRALLDFAIALRRAVDHLSQRAETSGACQRSGLGAERHGSCGTR